MIEVYVNGDWDASLEDSKEVIVWELGTVYQMKKEMFGDFIDNLEEDGYDCYFCPQLFSHPNWNGIIKYEK